MYKIRTEDVYEYFSKDREMFDFSSYSADSKYYDDSNKLVVGKIKGEAGSYQRVYWIKAKDVFILGRYKK